MTIEPPLDELYLTWLYSKVASVRYKVRSRTYWSLFRQLYMKEFIWIVPNDDNRVEDGRALRHEFVEEEGLFNVDPEWMSLACSMLEMLIGLSRRLAFEVENEPRDSFWFLMHNLDLDELNDANYDARAYLKVEKVIDRVIWRRYKADGQGGLFPLERPDRDQRDVEIWYQLNAYLNELD